MKDFKFTLFLVFAAAAVVGLCVYLTKDPGAGNETSAACSQCIHKKGRAPQGAGIQPDGPGHFISSYENDVTDEACFPGEFVFTGTTWNEVFEEKGESFAVYSKAYKKGSAIKSIRIIPLKFNYGADGAILQQLKEFLETAFSSEVTIQKNVELPEGCYDKERKQHNAGKILSGLMQNPWVHRESNLNMVIMKDDMFAPDLNYVFGYADYVHHISVISIFRLKSKNKKLTLKRVLKIARHEIAHMYGFVHCTSPFCVMRGLNSLEELDASTLSMCNGCAAKLAWRLDDDGVARSAALKAFYIKKFPELFR